MDVVDESTGIVHAGEVDLDELYDQRDLAVMMDCELPGNQSPDEFTSLGPLQKVISLWSSLTEEDGDEDFGIWAADGVLLGTSR